MAEKHEKMAFVAEEVLKIILARGFEGMTFSQVAKSAGVSRPWLYKYVGKTRQSLIEFGALHFGKVYSRLEIPVDCRNREEFIEHAVRSLGLMLDATLQFPWILPLYFRYKGTETPLGETVRVLEQRYLAKVEREVALFLKPSTLSPRALAEAFTWLNLGISFDWLRSRRRGEQERRGAIDVVRSFLESVR